MRFTELANAGPDQRVGSGTVRRVAAALLLATACVISPLQTPAAASPFYPSTAAFRVWVEHDVFCDIPEEQWGDRVFFLVFLFWENDGDLPFLITFTDTFSCTTLHSSSPGGWNRIRPIAFPPGTMDKMDDFWLHVVLIEEPEPFDILGDLGGFEPEPDALFFGLLDWARLAQLVPVGSATALLPVVQAEGPYLGDRPRIRLEPIDGGDADGDTFSTNNRYSSFHDCDDSDPRINPFTRELMDDSESPRDNNCDGLVGADYQRLLISTSKVLTLPAEGIPLNSMLHRRFRAHPEDIVTLLVGQGLGKLGQSNLSHIAWNGSNLAEGLKNEDVDAVVAIDRDTEVPGFSGANRLRAGDLILSFRSTVPLSSLGPLAAGLGEDVRPTDLVLFRRATSTLEMFFDGSDVGMANNLNEDIDAADLALYASMVGIAPGDLLLSTAGSLNASGFQAGGDDVFVFRPSSYGASTSGTFFLLVDGDSAWKKNVSALSLFELANDMPGVPDWAAQLMVATRQGYDVGPYNIGTRDLAVWNLLGGGNASFKAAFFGEYVDLASDDGRIDAVDLDRFAALMGKTCVDQTIDGQLDCSQALSGLVTLVADGTPVLVFDDDVTDVPANQQVVAARSRWLEPLPVAPNGGWGWDRLRPGTYALDFALVRPPLGAFCVDLPVDALPLTLSVNERRTLDLPLYQGAARISGFVWIDQNASGTYETGEEVGVSATSRLYLDGGDMVFDPASDRLVGTRTVSTTDGTFFHNLSSLPCNARYWLVTETQPPLQPIDMNPVLVQVTNFTSMEDLGVGFSP